MTPLAQSSIEQLSVTRFSNTAWEFTAKCRSLAQLTVKSLVFLNLAENPPR
jgi:hypothetical protein